MSITNAIDTPVWRIEGYLNKLLSDPRLLELSIGNSLNEIKEQWVETGEGTYFLKLYVDDKIEPVSPEDESKHSVIWVTLPDHFVEDLSSDTIKDALEDFSRHLVRDGLNKIMFASATYKRLRERPYVVVNTIGVSLGEFKDILLDGEVDNEALFHLAFSKTHFASAKLLSDALELLTAEEWAKLAELDRLFDLIECERRFYWTSSCEITLSENAKVRMTQGLAQSGKMIVDVVKGTVILKKSSAS